MLKTQASELAHSLIDWWELSGRRDPTQKPWMFTADQVWPSSSQLLDPYGVHVAEVMLQQTQLQVVLPYWRRWMAAFPTVEDLAKASLDQVRLLWQGLGYYSEHGAFMSPRR